MTLTYWVIVCRCAYMPPERFVILFSWIHTIQFGRMFCLKLIVKHLSTLPVGFRVHYRALVSCCWASIQQSESLRHQIPYGLPAYIVSHGQKVHIFYCLFSKVPALGHFYWSAILDNLGVGSAFPAFFMINPGCVAWTLWVVNLSVSPS